MFCKNCGNEIKENEKFCCKCGFRCEQEQEIAFSAEENKIVRKIDCAKSGISKAAVLIVAAVMLAIDALIYMDMRNSILEMIGKMFLLMAFLLAAYSPVSYLTYQKRFCLLKERSVNGVGCGVTDFTNSAYEFRYTDVISLKKKKLMNQVVVQTADKKIAVFVPRKEVDAVYAYINSKINLK